MILLIRRPSSERARHLLFFNKPALWPTWPFLPLIRRKPDAEDECGLLFDPPTAPSTQKPGVVIYLANLFLLPKTEAEFLASLKEEFDSPEAAFEAGWCLD